MMTYELGHLESGDEGACFPKRPYYPLVAGNGTDAISIGLGGFPDDPNWRCYSMQLPFRTSLGWFKTARKDYLYANRRYGVSTYGTLVALAAPTTLLAIGKEKNLGIRDPRQIFDPKKRILTTTFLLKESRGSVPAKIKVTSFLTDEHLLVERYELLQAPESGFRLGFRLVSPDATDQCELPVYPQKLEGKTMDRGFRFTYSYESPEIYDGAAATWTDATGGEIANENGQPAIDWTALIEEGQAVTHYVAVVDSYDAPDFCREIDRLVEKTQEVGYEGICHEHVERVCAGDQTARIELPEKDLGYLYDYSQYILDASFEAESGFLPMGILPCLWQNSMFWDTSFASMAWLGSNRADKAAKLSEFYRNKLPEAQRLAEKMDGVGARFAWTTSREHFELNAERVVQFHNNAVIALQCLQVHSFHGDEGFLQDSIEVIEQALMFITERLVKIENGAASLRACAGLDESTSDLKGTDSWTAATYAKALEEYLAACRKLKRTPFQENLDEVATMVLKALEDNVDAQGVLQSFAGGRTPHWGSLIYHLFPDHPSLDRTLSALSQYDAELDSYHSHGETGYRDRIFPWTEFWIARILAASERPEGWERLRQCAKFTDGFGSIPERVFYRGELLKQPFLTAHASYIWAINSLLVNRQGDRLAVLTNLPADWTTVSVENLTTPDGLKVSANLRENKMIKVEVVNLHQEAHRIDLVFPQAPSQSMVLDAGQTFLWNNPNP